MIKPDDPRQLAIDILERSPCIVKVGAVIVDSKGRIAGWGWCSVGNGYGEHAEAAAIRRTNKKRLAGSTIYVAGRRANPLFSRPCDKCAKLIRAWGIRHVVYTNSGSGWLREEWK